MQPLVNAVGGVEVVPVASVDLAMAELAAEIILADHGDPTMEAATKTLVDAHSR